MANRRSTSFRTTFGSYRCDPDPIGRGPTGRVLEAKDEAGTPVAIKFFDPAKVDKENRRALKLAVDFCYRRRHRNVVELLDFGTKRTANKDAPFLVMPSYSGNLRRLIDDGITPDRLAQVVTQLLDGVEAGHLKNLPHLDLKPENVLLDGGGGLVVSDWGSAGFRPPSAGLPYAPPEQQAGEPLDERTDIYALGVIIHELATGKIPSSDDPDHPRIGEVRPELGYLDEVLPGMHHPDPAERFRSIDRIKRRLMRSARIHLTRQRLDALNERVIARYHVDDPILQDPIRLVGDPQYEDGVLSIRLNRSVSPEWIESFKSISYRSEVFDSNLRPKGPASFHFGEDRISNSIDPVNAQRLVDHLKHYLELANEKYREDLEERARQMEEADRQELERLKEEEETRRRLLENLQI